MLSLFGRSKTSNARIVPHRLYKEDEQMLADMTVKMGTADNATTLRALIRLSHEIVHSPRLFDLFFRLNSTGVL